MSKYTLYSTTIPDAEKAGKRNRKYYLAFTVLLILLSQLPNYCNSMKNLQVREPMYIAIAALIVVVLVFLFSKLRAMTGSLRKIGTLELTQSGVRKTIGDLSEKTEFTTISKIELEDFFKDVSLKSKSDSRTKTLRIIRKDLSRETFIISANAIDFKKISVVDSMKTVSKITGIEVVISS